MTSFDGPKRTVNKPLTPLCFLWSVSSDVSGYSRAREQAMEGGIRGCDGPVKGEDCRVEAHWREGQRERSAGRGVGAVGGQGLRGSFLEENV